MKKFFALAAALLLVAGVSAQNSKHAIGLRLDGLGGEFVYQYHMSDANFLDVTLGGGWWNTYATCTYNWNIGKYNWTPSAGSWIFYGGVGGGLGYSYAWHSGVNVGVVGNLGLKFNLHDSHWCFGVDWKPMIGAYLGDHSGFWTPGLYNFGLLATYRF